MANFFTKIFSKVKGFVIKFYNDNEARIAADAKALAIQFKDVVSNYDLRNPKERQEAINLIRDVAERTGAGWARELLAGGIDEGLSKLFNGLDSNIKKFLHFALITEPLIRKYAKNLPTNAKFFALAIELALNEIDKVLSAEQV